jgi:hypothetical protein
MATTTGTVSNATSASYVEYSNVANKPALISGSSQVSYTGLSNTPAGIVSSSAQIGEYGVFATTGSNQFDGSQAITGSLTVTGQVVAQTLNVQQVTSSIVFSSGSNIFGNSLSNTQQFTGSVSVTGSLAISGTGAFSGALSLNSSANRINSGNELRFYRTDNGIYTQLYDGGAANGFVLDNRNGDGFNFQSAGTSQFRIASTGTATFSGSLRVGGAEGNFLIDSYTTTKIGVRSWTNIAGTTNNFFVQNSSNFNYGIVGVVSATGTSTGDVYGLGYSPSAGTSMTPVLNWTSGGNVGIGTASPARKLVVQDTSADPFISILGAYPNQGGILFGDVTLNDSSCAIRLDRLNNALWFSTDGFSNERMRITSGGDLLVGLMSSTYQTTNRKVVVANGTSTSLFGLVVNGVNKGYFYSDGTNISLMSEDASGAMTFGTNNAERMRITTGGRTLLLGSSSSPYENSTRALLELNHTGSSLLGLRIGGSERAYFYHNNSHLYIEQMLAGASIYVISISGGVYLTAGGTSWTSNSDERLKNINGNIENAVDKLMTLRTVNYSWKNDQNQKQNLGLIAQDVEKVFPQVIDTNKLPSKPNQEQEDNTEYLGVRYQELVPVLVKAIQELKSENDNLKSRLEVLEQA